MLSIKTMHCLAQYLTQAIISAISIQPYRQCLASISGFNGISIFHFLDKDMKGYLIAKDLIPLLLRNQDKNNNKNKSNNIKSNNRKQQQRNSLQLNQAANRIFSQIDSNNQKKVNRLEFISYLLPRQNLHLRQIIKSRMNRQQVQPQIQQRQIKPHFEEQLNVLSRMFDHIIRCQSQKLSALRIQLMANRDYSIDGVISILDSNKKGWIQAADIEKFIRGQGIPIHIQDIYQLIELHDSNMDGKILLDSILRIIQGRQYKSSSTSKRSSNQEDIQNQNRSQSRSSRSQQRIKQKKSNDKRVNKNNRGKVVFSSQRIYPSGRQCLCNRQYVASREFNLQPKNINNQRNRRNNLSYNKKTKRSPQKNIKNQSKSKSKSKNNRSINQKVRKATPPTTNPFQINKNSNTNIVRKKSQQRQKIQIKPFELRDNLLTYDKQDYNKMKIHQSRKIKQLQKAIKDSKNCLENAEKSVRKTVSYINKRPQKNTEDFYLANQIAEFQRDDLKNRYYNYHPYHSHTNRIIEESPQQSLFSKINFLKTIQSRKIPVQYLLNRTACSPIKLINPSLIRQQDFIDDTYGRKILNRQMFFNSLY